MIYNHITCLFVGSVACAANEFECNYLEFGCIPMTQKCDGVNHCADAADELTCGMLNINKSHRAGGVVCKTSTNHIGPCPKILTNHIL